MARTTKRSQQSLKNTAVPEGRRRAAQEALRKIGLQNQKRRQTSGKIKRRPDKNVFPPLSKVLKMDQFSVLEIVDSSGETRENIRVDDWCVFMVTFFFSMLSPYYQYICCSL